MAELDARQRASLPDGAFAYIDSKGKRKLPINDESHVRNALSRFGQVRFESEEARQRAFRKVLLACSEYGIAPIGFVTKMLEEARTGRRASGKPSGLVTLLMADIEDSTGLAASLGDAYPALLDEVRDVVRSAVSAAAGYQVDARGDEVFAAFGEAPQAVTAAIEIQMRLDPERARVRVGLHTGRPSVTETGYEGLEVNRLARVTFAGHGRQIVASSAVAAVRGDGLPAGVRLRSLGRFLLRGLEGEHELLEVTAEGLPTGFPAPRV